MILPIQMSFDRKTGREISRVVADVPDDVLVSKLVELFLECPPNKGGSNGNEIHNS